MTYKRYPYLCVPCGELYDSKEMTDAPCPRCGQPGNRRYSSTPLFAPTKTKGRKGRSRLT